MINCIHRTPELSFNINLYQINNTFASLYVRYSNSANCSYSPLHSVLTYYLLRKYRFKFQEINGLDKLRILLNYTSIF